MFFEILITFKLLRPVFMLTLNLSSPSLNETDSDYYYYDNTTDRIATETFKSYSNQSTEKTKVGEEKNDTIIKTHPCRNYEALIETYQARPSDCKGILLGPKGNATLSGYPSSWQAKSNCLWIICGHPKQMARLVWFSVNLDEKADELKVYTTIHSQNNTWDRKLNRAYMDIKTISNAYAKTFYPPILAIEFISRTSGVKEFFANYWMLDEEPDCEKEYFGEFGIIKSPRYPEDHISRFPCLWRIRVPFGSRVELNITDFIHIVAQCEDGYLEIRDGAFSTSALIKSICGETPDEKLFVSVANVMWIAYYTATPCLPFQLSWNGNQKGCYSFVKGYSGLIQSPRYSESLNRSAYIHCSWFIHINEGSTIQLEFLDLFQLNSVEKSDTTNEECGCSEIHIVDGNFLNLSNFNKTNMKLKYLGIYCRNQQHSSVQSMTNNVLIFFQFKPTTERCMDHASLSRNIGFSIIFKAVTNRVLNGFNGIIESFNYPENYPLNLNVTWIIEASEGNSIDLNFTEFRLENGENGVCPWDYLEIKDLNRHNKEKDEFILGKFCGSEAPVVTPLGDTVMLNFVTDGDTNAAGFNIEWKEKGFSDCVKIIGLNDKRIQNFSSHRYPLKYSNNAVCRWKFQTSKWSRLELRLEKAEIEWESNCKFDVLEVEMCQYSTNI